MGDEQLHGDERMGTLWPVGVDVEQPAIAELRVMADEGDMRQRREVLERRALDAIDRLLAEG